MKEVEKIKRISVSEEIIDRILKMVENKDLKPGEALPTEKELMEMFGVGRSSVREALRALQSTGVIERRQGMGTYLSSSAGKAINVFNIQNALARYTLVEMSEARRILEAQIAALSAQNATRENIAYMRQENARQESLIAGGTPE